MAEFSFEMVRIVSGWFQSELGESAGSQTTKRGAVQTLLQIVRLFYLFAESISLCLLYEWRPLHQIGAVPKYGCVLLCKSAYPLTA